MAHAYCTRQHNYRQELCSQPMQANEAHQAATTMQSKWVIAVRVKAMT